MFENIGSNFSLNHLALDELKLLPELFHNYGDTFNNIPSDKTVWMTYKLPEGSISFTRNTQIQFPEVAKTVVEYLSGIIDVPLLTERVHFLKTTGIVKPHRDEAGRNCCINIGVLNSDSAITKISDKDNIDTFFDDCVDYQCKDGNAYLLNTQKLHSVIGSSVDRFLITYGFGSSFDQILSKVRYGKRL